MAPAVAATVNSNPPARTHRSPEHEGEHHPEGGQGGEQTDRRDAEAEFGVEERNQHRRSSDDERSGCLRRDSDAEHEPGVRSGGTAKRGWSIRPGRLGCFDRRVTAVHSRT